MDMFTAQPLPFSSDIEIQDRLHVNNAFPRPQPPPRHQSADFRRRIELSEVRCLARRTVKRTNSAETPKHSSSSSVVVGARSSSPCPQPPRQAPLPRPPSLPSKMDQNVTRMIEQDCARLHGVIAACRSQQQRDELESELTTLREAVTKCRSATNDINFSLKADRLRFRRRLDAYSNDETARNFAILYGSKAKQWISENFAQDNGSVQQITRTTKEDRLTRSLSARKKLLENCQSSQQRVKVVVDEWKERSIVSKTMSYGQRVDACERFEIQKRASLWQSILMVLRYRHVLLQQKEKRLLRSCLARKSRVDIVNGFVQKMMMVAQSRRRRRASVAWRVLTACTFILCLFRRQWRSRCAVHVIADAFLEYRRRLPATDIIRWYKRAIIKCQRLARCFIHRRKTEMVWALILLHGLNKWLAKPKSAEGGYLSIPPPFELRLEVIQQAMRERNKQYAEDLTLHCRALRMEKKRRAASIHSQKLAVHNCSPKRPRPFRGVRLSATVMQQVASTCRERFSKIVEGYVCATRYSASEDSQKVIRTMLLQQAAIDEERSFVNVSAPWLADVKSLSKRSGNDPIELSRSVNLYKQFIDVERQ